MSVPAGWFPDPAGAAGRYRWWDGSAWTRWLSTDPGAPAPAPHRRPTTFGIPEPTPVRPVRLPVAVTMVIAVVIAALVGVGLTVAVTSDRIRTGPAMAPPPRTAPAAVSYRAATRTVAIQELQMVLPGEPYRCLSGPVTAAPFESTLSCDVVVHRDFSGTKDWSATVGVGLLPRSFGTPGYLQETGERLFLALRNQFFSAQKTQLKKFVAQPTDLSTPGKSTLFSGEVHYSVPGLPSRYDRMFLALVELRSGRCAAFYSVRPNDTPKSTLAVLNTSLGTLSAR